MGQNPFRRGQVRHQCPVGGVEVGVAYDDLGVVGRASLVQNPRHLACVVQDLPGAGVALDVDAHGQGQGRHVFWDRAHALFGKEGSDAVFKVWDDVQHGGRAVRIAAVVRRVSVEELHQLGVLQGPTVASMERPNQGKPMGPSQQPPGRRTSVGGELVEALFQEHAPRQVKRFGGGVQMPEQRGPRYAPPGLDVVGKPLGV